MQATLALPDRRPLLGLERPLELDGGLHLGKLKEDKLVVGVTVAVVLDEESERLVLTTLGKEEPRRFGHKLNTDEEVECEGNLDNVGNSLYGRRKKSRFENKGESRLCGIAPEQSKKHNATNPRPRSRDVTASKDNPSSTDGAKNPVGILMERMKMERAL